MDIKGDWKKWTVSGLTVLAMALGLLQASILATDTRSVTDNAIKNGSFEQPESKELNAPQLHADLVFGWDTTASDHLIEFGSRRNGKNAPQLTGNDKTIPDGHQFAELNADEESTLYQYATTVGGNVYEWGLSHRGRYGIDRMAVIIGPKQNVDPAKPSEDGRDQFMRMTDWVKNHAEKLGVNIPDTGCTQKITVYSKKFAANGGFQNDIGDAFSASPSDVYTEKWNVWIIGTSNTAWGNYGTKSSAYAAGNLAYSCRYAVPDGQTKTVFAFCSYSAATSNKTLGNLIDNIHFSLYQTITAAATAGGWGIIRVSADGKNEIYEINGSMRELVAADGSAITVQAVEPESGDVQFVGAYVTHQTENGLVKEFIPARKWKQDGRIYTYEHSVEDPADIVLTFVKKAMVIYEANGGEYTHGDKGTNAVSFAPQVSGDGSTTERGSYKSVAAETTKDGWRFDGWLLARSKTLLPAEHIVTYDKKTDTLTFTDNGLERDSAKGGATLIAQWKWRQRFVTASRVRENGTVSADIRENTECGSITVGKSDGSAVTTETNGAVTEYYSQANEKITATATAKAGYEFIGWYQQVDGKIDGKVDGKKYELISNQKTYTYTAKAEGVQTVYARFAPTHTVTYQWASVDAGKCPPNKPEPPSPGTVIDGGTYYISKDFIKDKTTIDGTGTKDGRTVPGKWVFTGWHDGEDVGSSGTGGDIVIRETELINVTGDRTLTGFWTFIPEEKHTLIYQFADNNRWSPSGSFELTENYYRGESVTVQSEPARNQTTDGEDVLVTGNVTLYGKWSFDGWKRSDTKDTVTAGDGFDMPGNDVTLTGQWKFTPYTYTVVYDTGDGKPISDPKYASYDYAALLGSSKPGLNAPSTGIPFGASIKLMELPAGTKIPDDKYFAGWSIDKPTDGNLSTIETQAPGDSIGYRKLKITKNGQKVTLYAVYKNKDMATVDFAVNDSNWGDVGTKGGSFTVQNGEVENKTVSSKATPRDGYHFVGWYEKDDNGKLESVSTSAINGTTLTVTTAMMQKKLKLPTGSREENGPPVLVVHYVAVFARDSFTVQFEPNGALDAEGKSDVTGEMLPQKFHDPNSKDQLTTLRKNEFKRPGYVFTGWAESKTGQGRTYADEAPFAEVTTYRGAQIGNDKTITLYAQWEKLPDVPIFYTPEPTSLGTVKLNGNAAEGNDTITVQEGTVYEKLNPETGTARGATAEPREGSVFAGWYNGLTREEVWEDATFTPKQQNDRYVSATYVARFRLYRYTLHYEANGGTGEMDDQIFQHGQAYPLKKCAFSREGYRFVGWATEPAGEVKYENQKSIKLENEFPNLTNDNEKVTLYAVWEEQSVTIGYVSSDTELGTVTVGSETIGAVNGKPAGSIAQPKSSARFDGWYSADGTLLSTDLKFVPTREPGAVWQGTTYYARFSARRRPSTPSTPAKPDETKPTLAPIPEMLNGEDHYAYLLGYEDGTVRPNGSISRAEVATVLFRLLKDDVRMQNLTKDNAYSDVSDTAWYAAAVSTLSKMGVISGYPDGTFRPNAPITRAEFAAMIARFDETAKSADTPFTDISGHWAENAIGKAYGNGWVEGSSKTVFCPESNLTRAETATLLNRVLHRLPEKESDLLANQIVWPDNPETFWGYLAIQEATNSHEYERKADGVHETQTAKRENRDWSKEFEQ